MPEIKTYNVRLKAKRDTEANWNTNDPVPLDGEIIVSSKNNSSYIKIGDGVKKFSELNEFIDGSQLVKKNQGISKAGQALIVDADGSVVPTDISGLENSSNKVTVLNSSSTNTQYPSAKAVYDTINNKVAGVYRIKGNIQVGYLLSNIESGITHQVGDVYNISDISTNEVYTETQIKYIGNIDLVSDSEIHIFLSYDSMWKDLFKTNDTLYIYNNSNTMYEYKVLSINTVDGSGTCDLALGPKNSNNYISSSNVSSNTFISKNITYDFEVGDNIVYLESGLWDKLAASVDLSDYTTESDVNTMINNKIAGVYRVKGSCTFESLYDESIERQVGDVWNVTSNSYNPIVSSETITYNGDFNIQPVDNSNSTSALLIFDTSSLNLEVPSMVQVNSGTIHLKSGETIHGGASVHAYNGIIQYLQYANSPNSESLEQYARLASSSQVIESITLQVNKYTITTVECKAGDNVVYTENGWDNLSSVVDLSDYVTSSRLSNYVTKTGYATSSTGGSVKVTNDTYGLYISSGNIRVSSATNTDIANKTNQYRPITPYQMANAMQANTHQTMSDTYSVTSITSGYLSSVNRGKLPASYNAVKQYIDNKITALENRILELENALEIERKTNLS